MQIVIGVLFSALLLIVCLDSCAGSDIGCALWAPSGLTDVCCKRCKPGNHMVQQCGEDPKELCSPCKAGTYTTDPTLSSCQRCTQCTGVQMVKHDCTSTSDTVCGCINGYRCGNANCPPGHRILFPGTRFQDSICSNISIVIPEVNIRPNTKENVPPDNLIMVIGCLSVIVFTIGLASFVCKHLLKKKDTKKPVIIEKAPTIGEPGRLVQQEDCSFCHPQQEQGGSMDSIASQDSKDKLLPIYGGPGGGLGKFAGGVNVFVVRTDRVMQKACSLSMTAGTAENCRGCRFR
ncbi:hypothetical protein JZ751_028302 [Albula glossodonta]|uniref:TNFR-Cys domain-containing protein n=1 Tax=Albula glossodonta TaxID=121402 RepID=A0A8T2NBD5_9TELE|nr:hypothetical protein JZ751_028302 [Albula glossodonta]